MNAVWALVWAAGAIAATLALAGILAALGSRGSNGRRPVPPGLGDDTPELCYRCGGPLPASVAEWWLSVRGVYCSETCADGGDRG